MMDQKKRKYTVDKNVYLFTNDRFGKKGGALYEFKISVTKWGDGKYVVDSFYNEGDTLEAIETFYDQRTLPVITSVAACVLGPNLLYLIPHDEDSILQSDADSCYRYMSEENKKLLVEERQTLPPCLFHLSQKKKMSNLRIESPLARKTKPILIFIGNKVFALSSPCPCVRCPEPCFESLVVVTNDVIFKQWTPLDCPPFHNSINSFDFLVTGFAVLEDEGLILVSIVDDKDTASYFSYNIHFEKWSPVCMDRVVDTRINDHFLIPSYLHDKAAVVNNNIYTYYSDYKMLLVFPYTIASGGDLLLESVSEVQGFKLEENNDDFWQYHFPRSGTVTKVDDQILCVIHIVCSYRRDVQHLCVTFVQLVGDGKECTTLKSFMCTLSNGTESNHQAIKSCFVMNDLESESDHGSGKRPVKPRDADDKALMEMNPCEQGRVMHNKLMPCDELMTNIFWSLYLMCVLWFFLLVSLLFNFKEKWNSHYQ